MRRDEDYITTLLRTLDVEPPEMSTVDVDRAMADGQRRRRARRLARYAASAAVVLLVVVAASVVTVAARRAGDPTAHPTLGPAVTLGPSGAPASATAGAPSQAPQPARACTLDRLPIPDARPMSIVTGADPTGRFILGRSYPTGGGDIQTIIWDQGRAIKVPMPGDDPALTDVTSDGTAVGFSFVGAGEPVNVQPWFYRDGSLSRMSRTGEAHAYAINEAGVAVGADAGRPVRWTSVTSEPEALPLPSGDARGEARAVDEDGTIVGNLSAGGRDERPYVWPADGGVRELPLPAVTEKVHRAAVYTLRNGWATGIVESAGDQRRSYAVRWNLRTGEVRVFPEFLVQASTVNQHGWQAGTDRQGRAVVLSDAGPVVLPDLTHHGAGEFTNIATTLSDDGRIIAGQADDAAGVIQAVAWRCG